MAALGGLLPATRCSSAPIMRPAPVSLKAPRLAASLMHRGSRAATRALRVSALEVKAEGGVDYVNDSSFKEKVLQSKLPVLLDFTAPWCGPCRMIAPLVDELAVEYTGKMNVYKVNVDDSPLTAKEFGLKSIPVVMLFKGGRKVDQVVGAVKKPALSAFVQKNL